MPSEEEKQGKCLRPQGNHSARGIAQFRTFRVDDDVGDPDICQGTLISREQYLADLLDWGYADARMSPRGAMSASEIAHWTKAIGKP